jgi:Domain of unknown function (DUF5134)
VADRPLSDLLAVAMLGVSVFCAGRLVLGAARRRSSDRDVDVVHLVMGISMAGMLTGWLTGAWNDLWLVAFSASTAWFGWGAVRAVQVSAPSGRSGGSHGSHLVGSATMLYMLVAMRWMPMGGPHMHGMAVTPSGVALPAVLAGVVVTNAVLAAASGISSLDVAVPAMAGPIGAGSLAPARVPTPGPVLAPRCGLACLVVMSVAMAYMILTVRP